MILQPCSVELTKVHYYDRNRRSQNMSISTISREIHQNSFNKNLAIKKNIFGHKWVLKINEVESPNPKKPKLIRALLIYAAVFFSLIAAVCFGIIFSLDHNIFRAENKNTPNENEPRIFVRAGKASGNINDTRKESKSAQPYCRNCTGEEICMKTEETGKPKCVRIINQKDPTGCGGLCKINTEYCKNLSRIFYAYQCLKLNNLLKCPERSFNCGNMCIPLDKRCNGKIDCSNMTDEKNCVSECNLETHFQCGSRTSCLDKSKLCDGKVDCWDKSDEVGCKNQNADRMYCEPGHIPCLNGQCIPKEKMCDKVFDCLDRSDEPFWCQQIRP